MPAPLDQTVFDSLSKLQLFCGQNAAEKGFDDLPDAAEILFEELTERGDGALSEYLRSAIESQSLALVHDEVSEAHEEIRSGHAMDFEYTSAVKPGKPEGAPSELADALIRILHISSRRKINLAKVIQGKLAYNATREQLNGRKF